MFNYNLLILVNVDVTTETCGNTKSYLKLRGQKHLYSGEDSGDNMLFSFHMEAISQHASGWMTVAIIICGPECHMKRFSKHSFTVSFCSVQHYLRRAAGTTIFL